MRLVSWLWGFATSLRRPGGDALWSPSWQASASLFGGFGRTSRSGEEVNVHTAGALPAVYRACSFISDALASVELRVVQEQSDGGKSVVEDTDAARTLADWSFPSRELFVWHAALGGNGFAVIRSNARGGASALEPIVPRRITAMRDETGALFYGILPLPSMGKAEIEVIPAEEMLHLKFRNLGDVVGETVFGIAPIVTAAEQLGLVLAARSFQAALWKNGALPSGLIETDKIIKQDVIDRIRAQWNEFARGNERGRVAMLDAGMKWKDVTNAVTPADSQLNECLQFGVNEVARLYAVPPSLLAQSIHASYSTSVEESRAAVLHCLRPWAVRLCDALGRALLTREQRAKGVKIEADLGAWLVSPGKESADYLNALVAAGILSTNEARNYLGYSDIPGGEIHRVPVNSTAMENLPKIGTTIPAKQEPPQ